MKFNSKYKAVNQLNAIITEIMQSDDYPKWDFVNGLLTCPKVLGETTLWLHWDNLLIHKVGCGTRAGDHHVLDDWNTEEDGTITLLPGKKLSEVH